jgi:phosphate transport system substrate-binding protein
MRQANCVPGGVIALAIGSAAVGALCVDDDPHLVWRGCSVSKIAFMEAAAVAYEKETGVEVQLSGGGATLGIEAAGSGAAELGGTCRACLPTRNECEEGLRLGVVAWDALVVIVHPDNPVENITKDQLSEVLKQNITNWQQLGGSDDNIVVVARRGKISGVGYSTRALILGDTGSDYGKTVVRLNSSGPVEKLIERQPQSIAITGISSAKQRNVKVLSIDGQAPTVENISNGAYPYFRPLYIAFKPELNQEAGRFVEWILGDRGQAIVKAQGAVTLAQGVGLAAKYAHFGDTSLIHNYESLMERARRSNEN